MRKYPILVGPVLAAWFALASAVARDRPPPHSIVLETEPGFCMGHCDWYRLTVTADGKTKLQVFHNDEVVRSKRIRLTAAQYTAFRDRLAPFRPVGDRFLQEPQQCDGFATDLGGYRVTWTDEGPPARLVLNDGCGGKQFVPMREALESAAAGLGFEDLPGSSSGVVASTVMEMPTADH